MPRPPKPQVPPTVLTIAYIFGVVLLYLAVICTGAALLFDFENISALLLVLLLLVPGIALVNIRRLARA